MIFEIGDIMIFQNNRKMNNFDINTMLSESDKIENMYAIMKGRQIILCKKSGEKKAPQKNWVSCKLSASSMKLSHRKWIPFFMQRPYDHQVTFRLSKEGNKLKEEISRVEQLSNSNAFKIDNYCLIKDIKIWNDSELWEELYNSKEFCLWDTFPFSADDKVERNNELLNLKTELNNICMYLKSINLTDWDEKVLNNIGNGNIEDYLQNLIEFYTEHGAGPEKKFFKYGSCQDIKKIPICYLRFLRVKKNSDINSEDIVKNFDERFERIQLMIDKSWKRADCEIKKVMEDFKLKQPDIISEKLACREFENREPSIFINPKDISERIKKFNN